jgi:hypothetical protein
VSYVQNVLIWTMVDEDDAIAPIQEWLATEGHGKLVELSDFTRGHKAVEAQWWGIACNYLDIPAFLEVVFAQKWEWPDHLSVLIEDQEDEAPTIYRRTSCEPALPPEKPAT